MIYRKNKPKFTTQITKTYEKEAISINRWTRLFLIAIAIISLFGCNRRHLDTYEIRNRLFIETFSAGLTGNLSAEYLTDSVSFRIYIGTYDDEIEWFYYRFKGDSIYIEKIQRIDETAMVKTIDKKTYNLTKLKKIRSL